MQKFESSDGATVGAGSKTAKTESAVLAASNDARVSLTITNDGEKDVYLAYAAEAVKNKGIRLQPTDPPFRIDDYTGVVSVVTAESESLVTYSEV